MEQSLVAVVVLAALGPACGSGNQPASVPGGDCLDVDDDGTPIAYETKPAGSLSSLPPASGGTVLAGRYHLTDVTVWSSVLPCGPGVEAVSATKVITLTSNQRGIDATVYTYSDQTQLRRAHDFGVHDTRMDRTSRCVSPGTEPAGGKTTLSYTADGTHMLLYYDRMNNDGSCGILVQTFTRQAPTGDAL